jgi:hypothetical protein
MKKLIAASVAGLALVAGQAAALDSSASARVVDRVAVVGAQGSGEEAGVPMWGVIAVAVGVIALGVAALDDSGSD